MRKLSEIEADWDTADDGPWQVKDDLDRNDVEIVADFNAKKPWVWTSIAESVSGINAQAIANAPTDIRDLLDWVKESKKVFQCASVEGAVIDSCDGCAERIRKLLSEVKE